MKTIFLVIPHFVFTSDLLRTKYIGYLSQKYRVVIITPMIGDGEALAGKYLQSPNVIYLKRQLENPRLWQWFKLLRIGLVNQFDHLVSVQQFYQSPNYKNNWPRRLARFLGRPWSSFVSVDFLTKVELTLLPRSVSFEQYVKDYQPSLVVTATPGFDPFEAELILLSQRAKIPTVAVNFTWDNLTTNCKHIRKTDYLISWNETMVEEAVSLHNYSREKIMVSGVIRFDPYFTSAPDEPTRDEFLLSKKLNPDHQTLLHTTVTKAYPFQKKYIRDLITLRENGRIPYVNLFFRTHPLDDFENYSEFFSLRDVYFEKAGREIVLPSGRKRIEMGYSDLLNLKYTLKYTDININYASTISIEACIFDKPITNIGYLGRYAQAYGFEHYAPLCKVGAVRVVKDDSDLPKFINDYLTNPTLDHEARQEIVRKYVKSIDGLSYKRSVDCLDEIIKV